MQTAVKVVISFHVNLNRQKTDVWRMFSTANFFKGNLASKGRAAFQRFELTDAKLYIFCVSGMKNA